MALANYERTKSDRSGTASLLAPPSSSLPLSDPNSVRKRRWGITEPPASFYGNKVEFPLIDTSKKDVYRNAVEAVHGKDQPDPAKSIMSALEQMQTSTTPA